MSNGYFVDAYVVAVPWVARCGLSCASVKGQDMP